MKKQAKKVNKCSEFEMHFRVGTEKRKMRRRGNCNNSYMRFKQPIRIY